MSNNGLVVLQRPLHCRKSRKNVRSCLLHLLHVGDGRMHGPESAPQCRHVAPKSAHVRACCARMDVDSRSTSASVSPALEVKRRREGLTRGKGQGGRTSSSPFGRVKLHRRGRKGGASVVKGGTGHNRVYAWAVHRETWLEAPVAMGRERSYPSMHRQDLCLWPFHACTSSSWTVGATPFPAASYTPGGGIHVSAHPRRDAIHERMDAILPT